MLSMSIVKVSAILLTLTALGGLILGFLRSQTGRPPTWIAMAHGTLAASGVTLMIWAALTVGLHALIWTGLVIVMVAGAMGVWLNLSFHSKMLPLPVIPIFVHGFVAFVGLAFIALGAFGGRNPGDMPAEPVAGIPVPYDMGSPSGSSPIVPEVPAK